MHSLIVETALDSVFRREWANLSPSDRRLVTLDCQQNGVQDFVEYQQSIGRGNLQTYANCLRVGMREEA
jgi:hypothetical protein